MELGPFPITDGPRDAGALLTGRAAGGIKGEDGLDGDVHGGDIEGFKHDLGGGTRAAMG